MKRSYAITLLTSVVFFVLIIIFLSSVYWNNQEKYFPEDEAQYVHRRNPSVAIAECHYQGMTPILTCSYDSKV